MRKIFTICFFTIAIQLLSQNYRIESQQQKLDRIKVCETNDNYITSDSLILLSVYCEKTGNYRKSLEYLKKWIAANDSISTIENRASLIEFQTKYETEKKDKEIRLHHIELKEKNRIIQTSLAGVGLILAAFIIIIILYKKKNQAYNRLMFQNLCVLENRIKNTADDDLTGENGISNLEKYEYTALDEEHKNQIIICLNKLIENKIYTEPGLTIKKLAEKCSSNRSYLSIVINENYHDHFNGFINKLRIDESKLILSNNKNNVPLKELYHILGFSSYSTFNEAFKKYMGVTPAFYKKTVNDLKDIG